MPHTGDMGARGVGERAELGEVAAAAEGRAVAGEDHFVDRRVVAGDVEGFEQRGAGVVGERVVARRPVEPDVQGVAVAVGDDRVGQRRRGGGTPLLQPRGELRRPTAASSTRATR